MDKVDLLSRLTKRLIRVQRALPAGSRPVLMLPESTGRDHEFEERNIHPILHPVSKRLFDDSHYSQATFEAFKFLDKVVQRIGKSSAYGKKLMDNAFAGDALVKITPCNTETEKNEQQGYHFLFAGSVLAIRNPRGHDAITDSPDTCLDHLALASMLLRRLEQAGFKVT